MDRETAQFVQTRSEEDIARTKQRQTDVTNYSIVLTAGIAASAKLFADDQIATLAIFSNLLFWLAVNAGLSLLLQIFLLFSLHRFRGRVREARKALGLKYDSPLRKLWGDLIFMIYFFGAAPVASFIAVQYLVLRSCVGEDTCLAVPSWLLLN